MSLDLRVGHIKACTLLCEMDGDTSYHIILGYPWLNAHKAMASTYHQQGGLRNLKVKGECQENGGPNPFVLTQLPEGAHVAEEPLNEAPKCMNDIFKNV